MAEFHISTSKDGVEADVVCSPIALKRHMMIGKKEATDAQKCLINIARGQVAFAHRMADPFEPNLEGVILATASKDEHKQAWKAVVYSADKAGSKLKYIGTHEMPQFTANEAKINQLQEEIASLRRHYVGMGRPILTMPIANVLK